MARLSSPAEVVAAIPVLCGFVPFESLVVLSLRGPRGQVGLTMRFDLGWCDQVGGAPEEVAARLVADGASSAVVVLLSEAPDPVPAPVDGVGGRDASGGGRRLAEASRAPLVRRLVRVCADRGVPVTEALLVRDGRWTSYLCQAQDCCPREGTPLSTQASPALALLAAAGAFDGRAVLPSREQLAASVAPPAPAAATEARALVDRARDEHRVRLALRGRAQARRETVELVRTALDRGPSRGGVPPQEAAALAVALEDVHVRDEVATWALTRPDDLLCLLQQTARLVVPPVDAGVCTLLAWVAYVRGDGGLANVALDRALASDPSYALAGLLRRGLDGQVAPSQVRHLLELTRVELRRPGLPGAEQPDRPVG